MTVLFTPRTFAKVLTRLPLVLPLVLPLLACSDVPSAVSTDVSTRDIRISIAVDGTKFPVEKRLPPNGS